LKIKNFAEGFVVDFNWRSARIRQLSDNLLEVPNSKLAQAVVTNFSRPTTELGLGLDLLVDVSNDLDLVERVATDVASAVVREVKGAVSTAPPSVKFGGISELGVKVGISFRVRGFTDQYLVRHELIKRLHAEFRARGIRFSDTRPLPPHA
jgi:small-conductance mechanosensitive channel